MLHVERDGLRERFEAQRRAFAAEPFPSFAVRKARLERLLALTERHEATICAAIARLPLFAPITTVTVLPS